MAQRLDGRFVGPGVVFVEGAGDVILAEFGAGFVGAEPWLLYCVRFDYGGWDWVM